VDIGAALYHSRAKKNGRERQFAARYQYRSNSGKKSDEDIEPWSMALDAALFFLAALAIAFGGRRGGPVCRLPALATLAPDVGHVLAVAADCLAAFLPRTACFFGIEFVRRSFLVCSLTALAGDFALLVLVHCSEAAFGWPGATAAALLRAAAGAARAFAALLTCRHIDLLVLDVKAGSRERLIDALVGLERRPFQ
jgi:hypothetical protein